MRAVGDSASNDRPDAPDIEGTANRADGVPGWRWRGGAITIGAGALAAAFLWAYSRLGVYAANVLLAPPLLLLVTLVTFLALGFAAPVRWLAVTLPIVATVAAVLFIMLEDPGCPPNTACHDEQGITAIVWAGVGATATAMTFAGSMARRAPQAP